MKKISFFQLVLETKDELQEIVMALTTKMYEQAAQAAQAGQEGGAENAQDDSVVDGEYEEVQDEDQDKKDK